MKNLDDLSDNERPSGITRRTLAKGMAWTAPTLAVAVAAPAFAASRIPAKGLNGWVRLSRSCQGASRAFVIDGTGSFTNGNSNDRGIWLFAGPSAAISNATIVFYFDRSDLTFTSTSGAGWSNLVRDPSLDSDRPATGYYAYKATYSGGWTYNTGSYIDNNGDAQTEVWLANTKPKWTAALCAGACTEITGYARRSVTVDGSTYTFTRGPVTT